MTKDSYCSNCETWSSDEEWADGDVVVEDEVVDSYVACPRCGHHFPPLDPPTRSRLSVVDIEQLMTEYFGEDWRNKAIVGPVGVFYLRDVFAEAGLEDPKAPRESIDLLEGFPNRGFQIYSPPKLSEEQIKKLLDPIRNAQALLRRSQSWGWAPWKSFKRDEGER